MGGTDTTNALFDFDNDARVDIYIGASDYPGNRGLLYHQTGVLQFEEVPSSDGIDHHRRHGVIVADCDRDGDLDLVAGHSLGRCRGTGDTAPCYPTANLRLFENLIG